MIVDRRRKASSRTPIFGDTPTGFLFVLMISVILLIALYLIK